MPQAIEPGGGGLFWNNPTTNWNSGGSKPGDSDTPPSAFPPYYGGGNWPPGNQDNNNSDQETINTLYAAFGISLASPADGPALDLFFLGLIGLYWAGVVGSGILDKILEDLRAKGWVGPGLPQIGDGPLGGEIPKEWQDLIEARPQTGPNAGAPPTYPRPREPGAGPSAQDALDQLKKTSSYNSNSLRPGVGTLTVFSSGRPIGINASDIYGPDALDSSIANNQILMACDGSPPETFPTVLIGKS